MANQQTDPNVFPVRGRLSFPNGLFEPVLPQNETDPKKKYCSATFLMNKKKEAALIAAIQKRIDELLKEPPLKGVKLPPEKICLRDGSLKDYDGYGPEVMSLAARNSANPKTLVVQMPQVLDRNGAPLKPTDGRPYAGCDVDGSIRLWVQDNAQGKRINASLRIVRFLGHNTPFGGGAPANADAELPDVEEVEV